MFRYQTHVNCSCHEVEGLLSCHSLGKILILWLQWKPWRLRKSHGHGYFKIGHLGMSQRDYRIMWVSPCFTTMLCVPQFCLSPLMLMFDIVRHCPTTFGLLPNQNRLPSNRNPKWSTLLFSAGLPASSESSSSCRAHWGGFLGGIGKAPIFFRFPCCWVQTPSLCIFLDVFLGCLNHMGLSENRT